MNLFCLVLLGCAGCNVPYSDGRHAIQHDLRAARALSASRAGLAFLHRSMRGPQGGPEVTGSATSTHRGGLFGTSSTTRRRVSFGNPSIPCGPCIQPGTSYSAHPRRGRLGQLEGVLTFRRSTCTRARRGSFTGTGPSKQSQSREEVEDEQHHRPGRRRRIHGAERGHEGCLVPEVSRSCRRMAPRRRGTHHGTTVRCTKKAPSSGHSPLCGLCHFRPLRLEGIEGKQVQELHLDGERVHHQGPAGAIRVHPMEGMLPYLAHNSHHAGCGVTSGPPQLWSPCGKAHPDLCHGMASHIQRRRVGEVEPFQQVEITAPHGPEGRKSGSTQLGPFQTMGLGLPATGTGRRLLADSGGGPSTYMACCWEQGHTKDPFGTTCNELHGRGHQGHHPICRHEEATFEVNLKNVAKEKEAEPTSRRPKLPRAKRFRRRRRQERKERKRKRWYKAKMLQLEQWYAALRRFVTRTNVCRECPAATSLYGLQFTRSPIEILPKSNTGVNTCGEGQGGEGHKKEETKSNKDGESEYSYTYETDDEEDKKEDKKEDDDDKKKKEGGDGGGNKEEPLDADSLDDYFRRRTFIFVHHFAGPEDPLTRAMLIEASKKKVLLKTYSVEKDKGTGDLLKDEPYSTHLRWAKRGYIDAYHSGFPCATFSRLKFREVEGLPGPVRTKDEPYGKESNSGREQQACDEGTVMACRSINIADAVADRKTRSKVGRIATLENPPESDHPQHLSAWELPEMKEFAKKSGRRVALFNTCAYQDQLPRGHRHFKPQKFVGTLMGIEQLCKRCGCGEFATYDAIIGPQKSKESGRYPNDFCEAYAKLAIQQLILMGKEEYLKDRMGKLETTIRKRKAEVVKYNTIRPPSRSPLTRRKREAREKLEEDRKRDRSSSPATTAPNRRDQDPGHLRPTRWTLDQIETKAG